LTWLYFLLFVETVLFMGNKSSIVELNIFVVYDDYEVDVVLVEKSHLHSHLQIKVDPAGHIANANRLFVQGQGVMETLFIKDLTVFELHWDGIDLDSTTEIYTAPYWRRTFSVKKSWKDLTLSLIAKTKKEKLKIDKCFHLKNAQRRACCVFLTEHHYSQGVICSDGHFISKDGLEGHVKSECEKDFDNVKERHGLVYCPLRGHGCEAIPYTMKQVAEHCNPVVLDFYIKALNRVHYQNGLERRSFFNEGKRLEQEEIRSQFRKVDGTYSAYQCPKCKFGPVEHKHCNDLGRHNGEARGVAHISNACPKCQHFVNNINDWEKWDGVFKHDPVEEEIKISEAVGDSSATSPFPLDALDEDVGKSFWNLLMSKFV